MSNHLPLRLKSTSTTEGSARVLMSPRESSSCRISMRERHSCTIGEVLGMERKSDFNKRVPAGPGGAGGATALER